MTAMARAHALQTRVSCCLISWQRWPQHYGDISGVNSIQRAASVQHNHQLHNIHHVRNVQHHLKPHCFAACSVRSTAAGSSCFTLASLAEDTASAQNATRYTLHKRTK